MSNPSFIPATPQEIKKLGWKSPDIILITGDANIDSPFVGSAVIARILTAKGYKVAIISQPDMDSDKDIKKLGEPTLFWGVSSGSIDSMVSNYTASGKKRKSDDLTPGGINDKRPDLGTIKYTNLIKQHFKNTVPVMLGGIEASLRRIPHYESKTKKIRRSILFDAKADYILYGMSDNSVVEFADALKEKRSPENIRGLCYISKEIPDDYIELQPYESVSKDKAKFQEMYLKFYGNKDALTAKGTAQKHGDRYLIVNPPALPLTQQELDFVYELPYTRKVHPSDEAKGEVRAVHTINHSITTHRGCYGECNFCSIAVHQGTTVVSRSEESILREAKAIASMDNFKGYITDLGGPTANMYGYECKKKLKLGACKDKRCLYPEPCKNLKPNHKKQIELIKKVEKIEGVKKVFIASGIRYDLILQDKEYGEKYLKKILDDNISGQLKIAPEHADDKILSLMGKPSSSLLVKFKEMFDRINKRAKRKNFLTYYFIAAYPGCSKKEMINLKKFCINKLKFTPEQIQIFTPTPSSLATLMYHTKMDLDGNRLHIPENLKEKEDQKFILGKKPTYFKDKNFKEKKNTRSNNKFKKTHKKTNRR